MPASRIEKAIIWLLYTVIVGTPLFYWKWSLFPYAVPKTAFFEALVELIFALWLALAISDARYRPRMTPLMWAGAAYLGMLTLAALTGIDAWRSFFSDLERAFGIVAYYHLAALALVVSSLSRELPWKKIWYASFGTSIATTIIAALQLGSPNLLLLNDMAGGRPGATFGNPTFLAGYLLMNIFLAVYYLADSTLGKKTKGEVVLLSTAVLAGIVGIFITETRGDILALFAGIFALVVSFAIRPVHGVRRKAYVLLAIILLVAAGGIWSTRTSAIWSGVPGLDRLKDLTFSGSNSDIGARLIALQAGWEGFLDHPLAGWGFENFNAVFSAHYDPKILEYNYAESNFDKPHNIALEMLDAGGILLFVAWLSLFAALGYEAWKLKDRPIGQFMVALIVAYLVRSLVIFDTIGPVLMLYLAFGWIDAQYRGHRQYREVAATKPVHEAGWREVGGAVVALAMIPALIIAYSINGTAIAASAGAWDAHNNLQVLNNPEIGVLDFKNETDQWNVYQWDFVRDYANTIAQAYFYNKSAIPQDIVKDAVAKMEQVAASHPNDAYNHYLLTDIYNLTYDIDPQNYLSKAEEQGKAALALSPNRQEIYFYLVKTKNLEGDNAGALALAKKALDLDPKVPDAHFYYGMLAFANGKNDIGYAEVETALSLGRQWHDFYEARVAGDYFADSGHLAGAIELYQAALKLQPTDIESEIKLGAAYFLAGNRDLAKQYLADAASKFDFKSSPAYPQYKPILDALGIRT